MAGLPSDESAENDNGVSGLPAEWGKVVIPDDTSELDDLAAVVRRELRADRRAEREEQTRRRAPVIIVAVATVLALISLLSIPFLARTPPADPTPTETEMESPGPSDSANENDNTSQGVSALALFGS